MDDDEPERRELPLSVESSPGEVSEWYCYLVGGSLTPDLHGRPSATELTHQSLHMLSLETEIMRRAWETRKSWFTSALGV